MRIIHFKSIVHWLTTPNSSSDIKKSNFINVQVDAIGVGLANGAAPFLPVFLTRLGASSYEVSLLTSMPAMAGLAFSIFLGVFLQKRSNIVRWFSLARLFYILSYAIIGLMAFFIPPNRLVASILSVWAIATIPQTLLTITFSVVMNAVAGPRGRYELLTRRWSIMGITTAVTVFVIGKFLDRVVFPLNYQIVFLALSLGGFVSYYFSSQLDLPKAQPASSPPVVAPPKTLRVKITNYVQPILLQKAFISFSLKRFIYLFGFSMGLPLFPLFFVRQLHVSDSWIATVNTIQTSLMIAGYFFWAQLSRKRGSRIVLAITTLGMSAYPILTAITPVTYPILIYAGFAGVFQAGIDLVFFDELMKTIPPAYSATFVSLAQSMQHFASIVAPIIASMLSESLGIGIALVISGIIRLSASALFALTKPARFQAAP